MRLADHGQRVRLENCDLVLPLLRDENRHRQLTPLQQQRHTAGRLERPLVEQNTELACERRRSAGKVSRLSIGDLRKAGARLEKDRSTNHRPSSRARPSSRTAASSSQPLQIEIESVIHPLRRGRVMNAGAGSLDVWGSALGPPAAGAAVAYRHTPDRTGALLLRHVLETAENMARMMGG